LCKKDTIPRERVDVNALFREMAFLFQLEGGALSTSIQTELVFDRFVATVFHPTDVR
jgi:hypothetical protein